MIPAERPLLARAVLSASLEAGEGGYSPYNHYFSFTREALMRWLGMGDALGVDQDPTHSQEIESIVHHELAHWVQAHGTRLGSLLASLRARQQDMFFDAPARLGVSTAQCLMSRRFGADDTPFVPNDRAGRLEGDNDALGPQATAFAEHWWRAQIAQRVFESPAALLQTTTPIYAELARVLVPDAPERSPLRGADDENDVRQALAGELDLIDLLEGFASANQYLYYLLYQQVSRPPWYERRVQRVIRSIAETRYGKAIRTYAALCPSSKRAFSNGLACFSAIVDLALNPPLDALRERIEAGAPARAVFDALYPPERFLSLCRAADDVPMIDVNASDVAIVGYQEALQRRSGVEASPPNAESAAPLVLSEGVRFEAATLGSHTLHDVERYWQRQAQRVRERHPSLVVLPSVQYLYAREGLREVRADPDLSVVLAPPLWSDGERHIYFGLPHETSHCLIFWSIVATVAYDGACGTGEIDLSGFPAEVRHSGIAEDAVAAVFRHFGFEGPMAFDGVRERAAD